jgi:hypothetical protein
MSVSFVKSDALILTLPTFAIAPLGNEPPQPAIRAAVAPITNTRTRATILFVTSNLT